MADGGPRNSEPVRAAQAGDAGCLGLLVARHPAVALAVTGHGQDAEDAVQEAALIALGRIGDIRDPDAAGPSTRFAYEMHAAHAAVRAPRER